MVTQSPCARLKEIRSFMIKKKLFTTVDLKKYLKQIKLPILLHTCIPISELPSKYHSQCYIGMLI